MSQNYSKEFVVFKEHVALDHEGNTRQPQQNVAAMGTNACLAQVGAKKRGGADRISLKDFNTCYLLYINIDIW